MVVAPNTNFVKGGVSIGSTINPGHGSGGVLVRRNLSQSLKLLTTTTRVVLSLHPRPLYFENAPTLGL